MRTEDRNKLVRRLATWGYLEDDVAGLGPDEVTDEEIAEAVALYQNFHGKPLDDLARKMHGRLAVADGDVGPATKLLMDERTCDVKDPVLGRGSEANWPEPCRDNITVSWNFKQAPGLSEVATGEIWQEVKAEYEALFEMGVILEPHKYPATRIYAALKALPGSTLAWSYLAQNNCAARLRQAYDSTTRWSIPLALGTWKHECGHAFGMQHTPSDRNSLMYPSMNGQTKLNQTDINQMVALGYKRRTISPPPPPVDPVDPDEPIEVRIQIGDRLYTHKWKPSEGAFVPNFSPF